MAAAFPSQYNTFLPSTEATKHLVVDYSRNPNDFALPQYVQYVPVKKNVGRYIEMTVEMAGRILQTDGADMLWADGADAPAGNANLESFEFKPYLTQRFASAFNIGELAAEQAEWDILAQHARIHAQRMMTLRTQKVVTLLQTSGNWPSAHTSAVSSISGVTGKHDVSTTARKDIKRSLDYGADVIRKATLGAVKPSELVYVVSPGYARKISVSQEIVDHIKGSPAAEEEIKKGLGPNSQYGLPSTLYGYPVRVEDAVKVTSRKGATKATSYIMSDGSPVLVSRVGGLEGVEGSPSFSTVTLFLKEEMTVESKHDRDNRKHTGRVVDDFDEVLTSAISGFLFTSAVD